VARGTVLWHEFHFNVAALNGRWRAHPLVYYAAAMGSSGDAAMSDDVNVVPVDAANIAAHRSKDDVVAWLAVHESLDEDDQPYREASRIVQVANSPYEDDHGVNRNSPETWDGRVLVVNRYDWGYEDTRGCDQSSLGDNLDDDNYLNKVFWKEVFLVDYNHAVKHLEATGTDIWIFTFVVAKTGEPRSATTWTAGSAGRFHETAERRILAHDPDQRPIYVKLSSEQCHTQRLADGVAYTGFPYLHQFFATHNNGQRPTGLSGPFGMELLSSDQIKSIQRQSCPETPLEPLLFQDMSQLINECTCDFVDRLANHAVVAAVAETADTVPRRHDDWLDRALPQRTATNSCDSFLFARLGNSDDEEASSLLLNQEGFTTLVGDERGLLWTHVTINGLARAVHFLLGAVLELASNGARNNHRSVIVPSDLPALSSRYHFLQWFQQFGQSTCFRPEPAQ
jgi:hypothetical protein